MTRLVTQADVGNYTGVNVSLSHELELDSGYRVLLLDDRGWSGGGTWDTRTLSESNDTARTCVGPDEPFGEHTQDSMARDHWATLAATAQQQGIEIDARQLSELAHDVISSPRLVALLQP